MFRQSGTQISAKKNMHACTQLRTGVHAHSHCLKIESVLSLRVSRFSYACVACVAFFGFLLCVKNRRNPAACVVACVAYSRFETGLQAAERNVRIYLHFILCYLQNNSTYIGE